MQGNAGVPAQGDLLAGRYTIERVVGHGGMGVVVAARDGSTGARVAVKLMHAYDARNPVALERFDREARVAGRLSSAHVTRLFDVGRLGDGRPFMVMEFLEGHDLARRLKERGPLPVGEAVLYAKQAASACVEAHAAGVVHRDIKPSNLVVTGGTGAPTVKLVDFGISKLRGLSGTGVHSLTASGDVTGSPLYMPPEQLRSKEVDGRADVWAIGATLYELLTGVRPFVADNMMAECNRILLDEPAPPSRLRPGLPPGLDDVILRCLQKDAGARFDGAAELEAALAPFAMKPPARGRVGLALSVVAAVVALGVAWRVWAGRAADVGEPASPATGAASAAEPAPAVSGAAAEAAPEPKD